MKQKLAEQRHTQARNKPRAQFDADFPATVFERKGMYREDREAMERRQKGSSQVELSEEWSWNRLTEVERAWDEWWWG